MRNLDKITCFCIVLVLPQQICILYRYEYDRMTIWLWSVTKLAYGRAKLEFISIGQFIIWQLSNHPTKMYKEKRYSLIILYQRCMIDSDYFLNYLISVSQFRTWFLVQKRNFQIGSFIMLKVLIFSKFIYDSIYV